MIGTQTNNTADIRWCWTFWPGDRCNLSMHFQLREVYFGEIVCVQLWLPVTRYDTHPRKMGVPRSWISCGHRPYLTSVSRNYSMTGMAVRFCNVWRVFSLTATGSLAYVDKGADNRNDSDKTCNSNPVEKHVTPFKVRPALTRCLISIFEINN